VPLIISPPTAPQPKPSTDTCRPVRPNLRFSMIASAVASHRCSDQILRSALLSIIRRLADRQCVLRDGAARLLRMTFFLKCHQRYTSISVILRSRQRRRLEGRRAPMQPARDVLDNPTEPAACCDVHLLAGPS